ncbi:acyl-ACP--UDP-N-acetylglucosamine O-acyltransferase [Phenylobacterium sp.]|uniref:acyl-ACP--UDP-N-acetylglucosamine O-acyltransferase n=1 Tax=Phenylobacterium sp. TaxID=1871053 RepID=UPI002D1A5783|nr:acyl-ACP--UDP-N-acetylglucosamine O-acyltransferase [Phenylobacterium sp.]HVI30537.1 acyl-ACP--UDP-N-acetylglucosamine O-acyltransferase [Phenylobacterium sp.]
MSVQIHPTALVAKGAELADGVSVGPFCVIGEKVRLGRGTKLHSHVVVEGSTELGENNQVYPFAVLGGPPQHTAYKGEDTRLVIGDNNLIREHATMNLGTVNGGGVTRVGSDGLYMIESHVGHDCVVGDHVILTKQATLGGHCQIGDFVIVGGLAAVHQFTRVGRHAMIGGLAAVVKDVIPYGSVWGNHAHLEGLNLVGLKRRGFSRESINTLRAAYRLLFADEGTFQERLDDTIETYSSSPEVMEIIDFIRADATRPLCLPEREV